MMTDIEVLYPRIMARVQGAPEPAVADAIRIAAQTFCQRTRLWREYDSFKLGNDGFEYVYAPQNAVLFEIDHASMNGRTLHPVSLSWLDENRPNWREEVYNEAAYITQVEEGTIRVVPAASGIVELRAILKPSDDATQLPDFIANNYRTVITDGALAELLTIPGQSFTNPDFAAYHAGRFQRALDELNNNGAQGQQKAAIRTKPHFF
jgi:hypothetical protein